MYRNAVLQPAACWFVSILSFKLLLTCWFICAVARPGRAESSVCGVQTYSDVSEITPRAFRLSFCTAWKPYVCPLYIPVILHPLWHLWEEMVQTSFSLLSFCSFYFLDISSSTHLSLEHWDLLSILLGLWHLRSGQSQSSSCSINSLSCK